MPNLYYIDQLYCPCYCPFLGRVAIDCLLIAMWKLSDPNGKDTLPEAEKQVQVMEEDVVKLSSRVAGGIQCSNSCSPQEGTIARAI